MSVIEARGPRHAGHEFSRRRLPLSVALGLTIGTLVLIALGTMLGVSLWAASTNTRTLLSDRTNLMLQTAVGQIRSEFDPAAAAAEFLAKRMESGEIPIDDPDAIAAALANAHAGLDQVAGTIFVRPDRSAIGVRKHPDGSLGTGYFTVSMPSIDNAYERIGSEPEESVWGPPTWSDELESSVLNVVHGVTIDGQVAGVVGVAVSITQFSEFLNGLADTLGQNAFALFDDDMVLAHPTLAQPYDGLSAAQPLPRLKEFGDPILVQIWEPGGEDLDFVDFRPGANGRYLDAFDDHYIFVYERLTGYSDRPITVGAYFRIEDVGREIGRLIGTGAAGVAITLVAILISFVVARKIARPFTRVAAAASQVGDLDLERIQDLPRSRIREIDDQARAFNGMVRALRWLEIYVPRRLARRLLDVTGGTVRSQDGDVTVMFTDITGFTGWSEGRAATEVADFLNAHFATVGHAIDETGGTLDKFIGDGVMAFWGAPERQSDHALRACRTAVAIAGAVNADNAERQAAGEPVLHLRIGIHCGTVTIGNIGAPERMNYTIVGDAVNVCQRLEQAGKDVAHDADDAVIVMVSEAVARNLPPQVQCALRRFGKLTLRGRAEPIETFLLDTAAAEASLARAGVE